MRHASRTIIADHRIIRTATHFRWWN